MFTPKTVQSQNSRVLCWKMRLPMWAHQYPVSCFLSLGGWMGGRRILFWVFWEFPGDTWSWCQEQVSQHSICGDVTGPQPPLPTCLLVMGSADRPGRKSGWAMGVRWKLSEKSLKKKKKGGIEMTILGKVCRSWRGWTVALADCEPLMSQCWAVPITPRPTGSPSLVWAQPGGFGTPPYTHTHTPSPLQNS